MTLETFSDSITAMIFFSGKGGLSGDIWIATMLAALGSEEPVERITHVLPWMSARLQTEKHGNTVESSIQIRGSENSPRQTWSQMRSFLIRADIDRDVKELALEILRSRQYYEARGLGFTLEQMIYTGKGVGDTLFDILGGTYFWYLLGRPPVGLADYLDVGFFPPPATRKLLASIPLKTPRKEKELTTPTAAALLAATYKDIKKPTKEADLVVVSGGRYAAEGRVDRTKSWHYLSS